MAVTINYGAAPTYVKLATQTLTSAATVTFSNIPQGYTDLRLIVVGGTTRATTSDTIRLQFNSDTSSKYSSNYVTGNGSAASAYAYPTQTSQFTDGIRLVGTDFGLRSMIAYDIMNYANTTTYKTTLARCVTPESTVIGSSISVGLWRSTSAITSIYLQGDSVANFAIGTTFTIYGIKAALVPKATGGDIIVQDGSYWYHAFRTTGGFTPKQAITCDVVTIAGGGSGGWPYSPGGGAGGLLYSTSQSMSAGTTYVCSIGAGGAGSYGGGSVNGANSTVSASGFTTLTAVGGGAANAAGGSGGGGLDADSGTRSAPAGTSGQGNAGGLGGTAGGNNSGGGGGGAGGAGGAAAGTGTAAGAGGVGSSSYSTWGIATGTGHNVSGTVYYAGGGGGGTNAASSVAGAGSSGGGGRGASNDSLRESEAGMANTGGGSGGGAAGAAKFSPKSGGSGIIIVRYPI